VPLLNDYLAEYQRHHAVEIKLVIEDKESIELSATASTQLIRIIQEALNNIRKHAQANRVTIRLESHANQVCLHIEDDGTGYDPIAVEQEKTSSFGLQIMRERAESVGGSMDIEASPGRGTHLKVLIPVTN
jgi:signal transduction histidine kinase